MASNICKSSCARAHEFNHSIFVSTLWWQKLNLLFVYVLYHSKSGVVGYCMHFIRVHLARDYCFHVSATVWQLLFVQLYFANAFSAPHAKAVLLHRSLVVLLVPRPQIKNLLLEMPERAKMFASACMLTLIVNCFGKLHSREFWAAY